MVNNDNLGQPSPANLLLLKVFHTNHVTATTLDFFTMLNKATPFSQLGCFKVDITCFVIYLFLLLQDGVRSGTL